MEMARIENMHPIAMNDSELLRQYQTNRSEEAFRALIDQYVSLVYCSCRRQLRDRHLAEDATQAVFVLLSQKAGAIRHSHPAGWLLITARYTCSKIKKMELRRRRRETAVAMEQARASESENEELLVLLDDGLSRLRSLDREAIALRFLQGRSVREVAEVLGISEHAARKRVDRSVDKLRGFFARKGIVTTAGALPAILDAQMHAAAPSLDARASITHGILSACHGGAAAPGIIALAKGTNVMMQLSALKMAAMALLVSIALLTTGWWSARQVMADGPNTAPAGNSPVAAAADAGAAEPQTDDAKYLACRHVLEAIIDAHDNDDAAAFKSSLYFSSSGDPQLARLTPIFIDVDLAVYRVQKAAIAQFGARAVDMRFYWTTSVMGLEDVLSRFERKDAQVSGDTVVITPSEPFFPRPGIWPRAPIYFRNIGGVWKIDVARSVQVKVSFRRRVPLAGETADQTLAAAEKSFIDSMNTISDDTASGQIENPGQLQRRLDGAIIGVALTFSDFTVNFNPK